MNKTIEQKLRDYISRSTENLESYTVDMDSLTTELLGDIFLEAKTAFKKLESEGLITITGHDSREVIWLGTN